MCNPTEPVLASFVGGTPHESERVIKGLTTWKRVILLRFNDASRKCTGTASKSQISCYMDPADWEDAKAAVRGNKTLRVHGKRGESINVTSAAWSEQ